MRTARKERQAARVLFVVFLALTLLVLAVPALHHHEHPQERAECAVCCFVWAFQALLRQLYVMLFTALPFLFFSQFSKRAARGVRFAGHPTLITLKVRMNP